MLAMIAFGSSLSRKKLRVEMFFDEPPMEDEQVDQEEVWSAIRYLDPDEQGSRSRADTSTIIAVLALLLIVCAVWVLLWLRVGDSDSASPMQNQISTDFSL